MMKIKILSLIAGVMVLASSCTTMRKSIPTSPINTQVNLTYNDLVYVGEVTGTSTQSYVLGIPYGNRRNVSGVSALPGSVSVPFSQNRGFNNAMYDALMSRADADFILPISVETKTNVMFLGREETITIRAKAFRIKTNN